MFRIVSSLIILVLLTSCVSQKGVTLKPYSYQRLSGWEEKNIVAGLNGFKKTCGAINSSKILSEKLFADNRTIWNEKCAKAKVARSGKKFFEDNFSPYLVSYNGSAQGTFTGYFEKEIEASFRKDSVYKYPIYKTPRDPRALNFTRREIENGALKGKGLEIAYAKSAAKLFFLHIQGSGILRLPDGKRVEIGYAAKNNHAYTGVGSYMLQQGMIEHGSAEEMVHWLEAHPISARSVMNRNERYVFFSLKNGGPYGSLGVELTDLGSIAVDPNYVPLGVPLWLQTTLPVSHKYFGRLLNAQDTGSAIKGPIRGDIFFGEGDWAWKTASGMKNAGSYFMLIPKGINPDSYF